MNTHAPRTLRLFCLLALLYVALATNAAAQSTHSTSAQPGLYQPVADPKATVTVGKARFTVLTPQLIRMEWAADGKFEDHASMVFLNRKLPVPKFDASVTKGGTNEFLILKTSELSLSYTSTIDSDGHFTLDNLHIEFTLNGK